MICKCILLISTLIVVQCRSILKDEQVEIPKIILKSEWSTKSIKAQVQRLQENPPSYVVIHHSATDTCTTRAICQARIRNFQDYHIRTKKWNDIGYNFLIGEDGNIYEGQGWDVAGNHTSKYNEMSIGICIIGNYNNRVPNQGAIRAVQLLIEYGISSNKINEKYSLIGHRQAGHTNCPGDKLYELLKTWTHWTKLM
ncbi:peptidoglycan-recognition protein SC2-like [Trichogramma pretiosum]|uniref:peptidoglycan-recognition protein SC2-like n=1 Tax=Trichogramma pretiosum TaxID=7493 RepID=UPI0006C96881|nr:peptidoglycan-recognition protein SC2-like [Trichogramma pretiosum]